MAGGFSLAQRCDICGKGTMAGNNVSHAHNLTKRTWNPNLQRVRAAGGRPGQEPGRLHPVHPQRQGDEAVRSVRKPDAA